MAGDQEFYWCVKHSRVEASDQLCAAQNRLGPYPTRAEAEQALDTVRRRNEEWEAEDARWAGDTDT
ncbi:MAG: hypothetical protein ACRDT6_01720 [Micromonosporaceae bacterium]